jgi:hypothetical protein
LITVASTTSAPAKRTMLDRIESLGNKVLVAQRYKPTAGLGTIVAMMIPFSVVVLIVWLVFFIAWFVLGIPMGPGYPASL